MEGRVSNVVEEHDGKENPPKSKPVSTKQSFIKTWEAGVYQITRLNLVLNAVNQRKPRPQHPAQSAVVIHAEGQEREQDALPPDEDHESYSLDKSLSDSEGEDEGPLPAKYGRFCDWESGGC